MNSLLELSDEELMTDYQNGNEQAFEMLYQRYSGRVYGFLKKRLTNQSLAEDLFQATFLKLHRSRHQYSPAFPFVPWLFTVTRTVLADGLRAEQKRNALTNFSMDVETLEAPSLVSGNRQDLAALNAKQIEVIQMRFEQDRTFEEIAKHLKTTPLNARQLLSRAIRKLRGTK